MCVCLFVPTLYFLHTVGNDKATFGINSYLKNFHKRSRGGKLVNYNYLDYKRLRHVKRALVGDWRLYFGEGYIMLHIYIR